MVPLRLHALVLALLTTAMPAAAQTVAFGPIASPWNGSRYYRLTPAKWHHARDVAVAMGGNLVTINDEHENEWVRANVAAAGGNTAACIIGLLDTVSEGNFVWLSGEPVTFTNWAPGEPNNQEDEDIATMSPQTGLWNDIPEALERPAIVEVPGPVRVPEEFPTIAAGIAQTAPGNDLLVGPGTYTENIEVTAPIRIRSTGGPLVTTINGGGQGRAVRFINCPPGTALEGFTIGNGVNGIETGFSVGEIRSCIIRGNTASSGAGFSGDMSYFKIIDCVIAHNHSPGPGAAIHILNHCLIELVNCTIIENQGTGPGAAIQTESNSRIVGVNSIVRGSISGEAEFFFSNVLGIPGNGNITADPLLGPDFRLSAGSPCIDAGSNSSRVALGSRALFVDMLQQDRFVNDPDVADTGIGPGSVIDMGPMEFQGVSGVCAADFNKDGFRNPDDLADFITTFFLGIGCP